MAAQRALLRRAPSPELTSSLLGMAGDEGKPLEARVAALEQALVEAGFAIDVRWHAGGNQAVFLVARRPARA